MITGNTLLNLITAEKVHSGFIEAMAVISAYFEKWEKDTFTICLNSRNNWGHCGAVEQKLHRVKLHALLEQGKQVRVPVGDVGPGVGVHGIPGAGQGGAGQQEG